MPFGGYNLMNRSAIMRKFSQTWSIESGILKNESEPSRHIGRNQDDSETVFDELRTACSVHRPLNFGSTYGRRRAD